VDDRYSGLQAGGVTVVSTGTSDPYGVTVGRRTFYSYGYDSIGTASSTTSLASPPLGLLHRLYAGLAGGNGSGAWINEEQPPDARGWLIWYECEYFNLIGDGAVFEGPSGGFSGGAWKAFGYWGLGSTVGTPFSSAFIGGLSPYNPTRLGSGNIVATQWFPWFGDNLGGPINYMNTFPLRVTVGHNMRIEWIILAGDVDQTNGRVICYLTDLTLGSGPTKVIDSPRKIRRSAGGLNGGIYRKHYTIVWGGGSVNPLGRDEYKLHDHLHCEGRNRP
jgi:hypothetical protein